MKKWTIAVLCIATILCSSAAFADDDVKVTLGLKGWYNWWTHSATYSDGSSNSWNNGSAFMIGPSLNLKFGKVFLGASYLQSTSNYKAPDWFDNGGGDTMEFERKDLDLTVGFMFTPYFGAFVGYKTIDAPMKYTNPNSTPTFSGVDMGSWKLKGPGIGILGNAPLGRSAAFYGNLAFLSVKQEYEYPATSFVDSTGRTISLAGGTTSSYDMTGGALEFGVAFAMTERASANVGFKYQTFSGDSSAGTTHTQTFYGPVFGLNLSF